MRISRIHIHNFRNIEEFKVELSPYCNLFYGANGSGKTSILEAIYYLSTARSFRSHLATRIVKYEQDKFTLFASATAIHHQGDATQVAIGIERPQQGLATLQLSGENVSVVELAKFLPMQLLHQDSFELLTDGPKHKRKYIDWGMFHVEPGFLQAWKNTKRALEQRNAALMLPTINAAIFAEIDGWDQELAKWGKQLHFWREQYVAALLPVIDELLLQLLGNYKITVEYYAGWDANKDLYQLLRENFERDKNLRRTQLGPHRADLRLLINNVPVQDCLSRGQQKVFICIMHLAQGLLLRQTTGSPCIYLIDDLAAELDRERQQMVATILRDIDAQVFLTSLDMDQEKLQQGFMGQLLHEQRAGQILPNISMSTNHGLEVKMFHVKQGRLENVFSDKAI
jgi:DNA replication and repair protein RecF